MTGLDQVERRAKEALIEESRLVDVKLAAHSDPKVLIAEMEAFDPETLRHFGFTMFMQDDDPLWPYSRTRKWYDAGWIWQAEIIDWWQDPYESRYLILKARQLGVTWLAMAMCVWYLLFRPGSKCAVYSYTEDEAKKLITSAWSLFLSLPEYLRNHVEIMTPIAGKEPSEWIRLRHKGSGLVSTMQAMTATPKAGHGDRITFGFMDEVSRMDHAKGIYTALLPAATSRRNPDGTVTGKLVMNSTANGVGNEETGEGNYFHILYATRKAKKLAFKFLPWNLEPTRDEKWYQEVAMGLDDVERNQQYPLNETDAFMLSGALYFDRDGLEWYRKNTRKPRFSGQFTQKATRTGSFVIFRDGIIDVFEMPVEGRDYGIAVDTATGRGTDYTAAGVIDLSSGAIVAELHARIEAPRAAVQLHFLGKWYNTAKIAVERQGGYGDALITFLRDGTKTLPVYPNMYRHTTYTSGGKPLSDEIGMPMGPANRSVVLDGLKEWIRLKQFPWLSHDTVHELGQFVYHKSGKAQAMEGVNDDRVMMLAIAADLFRQFGHHAAKQAKFKKAKYNPPGGRSA
jgi:hypothetical protein